MASELTVLPPRGVSKTFDPAALLTEWQADLERRAAAGELAEATVQTYRRGMARFLAWTSAQNLERIGPQAIREWKAALLREGHKPQGVNTFYCGVRSFFHWAVAERGLAYDPTAGVGGASRQAQNRKHKREALTDDEVLRVLAQPDGATVEGKRDRAMLHIMAYTGARSVEVQRAVIGDLQTGDRLRLRVQGKGRAEADEALYLVNPALLDALYAWLAVHPRGADVRAPLFCGLGNRNPGGPLTMKTIRRLVKTYYKSAGVVDPRKTTHSLRHSLVTNLIRRKVPPTKIMTVTRHRSVDTLLVYAHEIDRDSDPAEAYVNYGAGK